jgi:hypothetical protein
MACAVDGTLIDLPSMQAYQRAPVVTALAVMMRAIELYAENSPQGAPEWEAEWGRQVSTEALRLVAPAGERAFFQPPSSGDPTEITIEEVDRLTVAQRHAVKPQRATTPERAAFALSHQAVVDCSTKWPDAHHRTSPNCGSVASIGR